MFVLLFRLGKDQTASAGVDVKVLWNISLWNGMQKMILIPEMYRWNNYPEISVKAVK